MARRVDIERAQQGTEVWNIWAEENPDAAVDFSETELAQINFSGFNFPAEANFHNAQIHDDVSFANATFRGDADFNYATFLGSAQLQGASFEGQADFSRASFRQGNTNFDNVRFNRDATFADSRFDGSATSFTGAEYLGDAIFETSYFQRDVSFANARFTRLSQFRGAQFLGVANFDHSVFNNGPVSFSGAKFGQSAKFSGAYFGKQGVDFFDTNFRQSTTFAMARFAGDASFRRAQFHGAADFLCSKLDGVAAFDDAKFVSTAIFKNSAFGSAPTFHGAQLHEDTTFEGVVWPGRLHKGQSPYDAARAWARLRIEMDRLQKHEDELLFFAQELNARVQDVSNEPPAKRMLYWCYMKLGAGRNVTKPLSWLLGLNAVLFLPVYWYAAAYIQGHKISIPYILKNAAIFNIPADIVSFTLGHALPFIGATSPERHDLYRRLFGRLDSAEIDMPLWLEFVAISQQLVGVVLLFMIGLSLRNRFRMK